MRLSVDKRKVVLLLAAGFLYLLWIELTDIAIPCVFRTVTHLLCPGCGITTMFRCIAHLDFAGAYQANAFVFVTLLFPLCELLFEPTNRRMRQINNFLLVFYVISLIIWGILRNL